MQLILIVITSYQTMSFLRNRFVLITGLLTLTAYGGLVIYIRRLDRSCPKISITQVPKSSACRNLVEKSGERLGRSPYGMDHSTLLASWPKSDSKTRWVPSFAALQVEVPVSLLARYGTSRDNGEDDDRNDDAFTLMQNLVAAFLDARSLNPEAWFLDRAVPPLSFAPSTLLFGSQNSLGAWMLGTWSSARGTSVQPSTIPPEAPQPISEFFSNQDINQNDGFTDTAGAVIYWKFPDGVVRASDKAASYGSPWRLMDGGFQEFIVEKKSEEIAVVTWVMVECSNLHPGGRSPKDFRMIPKLAYEAHVIYAQSLLYNALQQLQKSR